MAERRLDRSNANADVRLSGYVTNHRIPLIIITAVIIAGIVGYCAYTIVTTKVNEKGIARIDTIEYVLTNNSSGLSDTELEARRTDAMKNITPLLNKHGIVGVRANMLAAEIAFERKNYADAKGYWNTVSSKGKKTYTEPVAYFNEAVCSEEVNDTANAAVLYGKAADSEDFMLAAHARFSQGRVYETIGDYKKAAEAYNKITDKTPDDTWAHLAKTRLISMKTEGKIE